MWLLLRKLFGVENHTRRLHHRSKAARPCGRYRLQVEGLEDRVVPSTFVPGTIQGQDGWTGGTVAIPAQVVQTVDQTGANAHAGVGAWQVSNSTANGGYNGNFGGWAFGPGLAVSAGQPSSGAGADRFSATYFFKSASTLADGSNIEVDLGTSDGNDRNTFMAITNEADGDGGLQIRMAESNVAAGAGSDYFYATQSVVTNITRGVWHRIDVQATFIDGVSNDTFQVSLDGGAPITNTSPGSPNFGTSNWGTFEGYRDGHGFAYELSNRMYFRSGAAPSGYGAFSDTGAAGFYFDDVSYKDWNSIAPSTILASYAATFEPAGATANAVYVDDNWAATPIGVDPDGAGPATAIGYDAFSTIQEGINSVTAGGTVNVAAGTYAESVNVNKSVVLLGAQHGVDAQMRSGGETIVDGTNNGGKTPFNVTANDVTIDGFTVQGATNGNQFGFGILLGANTSGAHIVNDIIQNNIAGLGLSNNSSPDQAVIQHNLFQNNTQPGPAGGTDIYTDQFVSGGLVTNALIDSNTFTNSSLVEDAWALGISNTSATPFTNITFSNNAVTNHGRGIYFYDTSGAAITGNTITGATHYAIGIFGNSGTPANASFTISGNTLTNNTATGSDLSLQDVTAAGPAYTGTLTLTGNNFNGTGTTTDDESATPIDATNNTFNGVLASSATTAQLFAIEDTVVDAIDVSGFGLVRLKAGNVYVTPQSFLPPTTTTPSIQRGIDAASAGDTVNVAAGTYANNLTITKSLTLAGAGIGSTIVNAGTGTGASITSPANSVTLQGLSFTGTGAYMPISASGVTNLVLSGVEATGGSGSSPISNVSNFTYTTGSGGTPDTITLSGSLMAHTRGTVMQRPYAYSAVQSLTINTGSGNDTVGVVGTSATTHLFTGAGNDTVGVSAPASLGAALNGALTLDLGAGANTLQVAEAASTSGDVITVTANSFLGQGAQPFTLTYAATGGTFAGVSLVTGSGADQVAILGTAGPTGVVTGGGNDTVGVAALTGALGSALKGALSLDLGSGANTVQVAESANTSGDVIALTATQFLGQGAHPFIINYSATGGSFGGVSLVTGSGDDQIGVFSTAGHTGIRTEAGNDVVGVSAQSGALGHVLNSSLLLDLGSGSNSLAVSETADTSADTIALTANQFLGQGATPFTINYAATGGTFSGVSLATGAGADIISVFGTAGPTAILTGNGNDTISVAVTPSSGYNLTVPGGAPSGGTSGDRLTVTDTSGSGTIFKAPSSATSGTLVVVYSGGMTSTIPYSDIEQLTTSPAAK